MPNLSPDEKWRRLVAEIAAMPGVARRLIAAHKPDGHGRCVTCSMHDSGPVAFPCTLHALGVEARHVEGS